MDGSQSAIGWRTLLRFLWHALPHIPKLLRWRRGMARTFGKENSGGITEYADLNLVFTSRAFHPENGVINGRFRFVGPAINPSTRPVKFPWEQLKGGTKIYISLGTINHLNPTFYQSVFTAFANYPAQFILSVGQNSDIDQLGPVPANFIVRNHVPQLEILPQVDAFITHGGMNSVHEGLYYGVAQIVVPSHLEQLLNGKRVAETQTGILLGGQYPYGRVTAAELRQALDTLLHTPHYRQNAIQMGQTLQNAGGYLQAVAEVEAYCQQETRTLKKDMSVYEP